MSGLGLESLIPKRKSAEAAPPLSGVAEVPHISPSLSPLSSDDFHRDAPPAPEVKSRPLPSAERKTPDEHEAIFHIEVHLIKPNPYQPRREMEERELLELSQSIRNFGILQPLVVSKKVRETESGTVVEYELIAGERRLRAAKKLGLERVPAVVRRVDDNRTKLELALIENLQRSNLSAFESARAYARLQDEFGLTQREIASRVGKSREVVANTLRLLDLPMEIKEALATRKLSESQARALLSFGDPLEQDRVFHELLSHDGGHIVGTKKHVPVPADPEGTFWERKLEEKFCAPVKVVKKGNRGKIEIRFQSEEEWHGLVEKLAGPEGGE